jgi:hypothetical protein
MAKKPVTASKAAKTYALLTPDSTVAEALEQLTSGHITADQYAEWDAARLKVAQAKAAGPKKKDAGRRRTECPLTFEEFIEQAKALTMNVNGQSILLEPRQFSSGSFGWGFSGKIGHSVGGEAVKVQCSLNMTVVGSKPE